MEFPSFGKNCGEPTCKQLDFLPFTCDACKKVYCLEHHKYADHNCTEAYLKDNVVPVCPVCNSPVPVKRGEDPNLKINQHIEKGCEPAEQTDHKAYVNQCTKKGCRKREAIPVRCATCRQNFCFNHRLESNHECPGKPDPRAQAAAAADKRQANSTAKKPTPQQTKQTNPATTKQQQAGGGAKKTGGGTGVGMGQVGRELNAARQARQQGTPAPSPQQVNASMTEDEALARAIAASLDGNQQPALTEEERQLQEAIEASVKEQNKGTKSECVIA
eukprot:comp14901_c0_seq1/m.11454 comp14901_c0_seq1/g.11454  ORF comp14901_c0_seq1/g.11454 comp14901_c0_seq1/m.11454 type:complete len:274 (-) comp14901_c0_seq1:27-848(-)